MRSSSRSARIAAFCFAIVAGLVIGGLSWATVVSLRLERAQARAAAEADHSRRMRLALWRIDPLVMNVVAKEASRPYWCYSAFYYAPEAMLVSGESLAGDVIQPSPLVDPRNTEEWILLHFQLSPRTGWNSPQLPAPEFQWLINPDASDEGADARAALLDQLATAYTYPEFGSVVADAESAALAASRWSIGEGRSDVVRERNPRGGGSRPQQQRQRLAQSAQLQQRESRARANQNALVQELNRPPQACDPLYVFMGNLSNGLPASSMGSKQASEAGCIAVSVSPMIAFWMELPDCDGPLLAMVRSVDAEGITAYQGFLIDWPALAGMLEHEIADLFDEVRIEKIAPGTNHDPESALASIPARVVTPPAAVSGFSILDGFSASLLFAWGAAFVALTAVGLGIRSLLVMSERRSRFAYAVTHELRTPLTTLCLYTDLLSDGLVSGEKRDAYIEALRDESRRLSDLVSGILEYSRVENQTVRLETRTATARELMEDIRAQYEPRCAKAGMQMELDVNGLGETSLQTDAQLVTQIVGNLIDNACKYASGGADPRVRLALGREDGHLTIDVEDNGPGIGRHDRRHVFKAFRRGQSGNGRQVGGVGLGLALARSWARLLGGRLRLETPVRPRRGARFRLTVPLKLADDQPS